MYLRLVSGIMFRRFNSNFNCETIRTVHFFPQNCGKVHSKFKWCKHKMTMWLQEQSIQVMKACTRQFEFIAAQRVRRSLQIFYLYTKIWDEVALKEFIRLCKCRIARNTKNFLMGAVGVTIYNWEQERITDNEIYSYFQEIEKIHRLKDLTVICPHCHLRVIIDANQPGIQYCQCYKIKHTINIPEQEETEWEPFTECKDMLVWRREEPNTRGLYSYKVYGSFDDVSAEDFLQVQIDLDYRTKWDATVKQLKIIDTDPLSAECFGNSNDIIYWETIWPRMFANRDYVYQRKWLYNKERNVIIILNKGTDHPNAPDRSDTYRVTAYWSYIVIKPFTNIREPGLEFVMTYFDNPGMNVPGVTTWIFMSGLTNYLCQLREAVKNYKNYKAIHKSESNSAVKIDILDIKDEQDNNEKYQTISNSDNEVIRNVKDIQSKSAVVNNESENENVNEEESIELDLAQNEERKLYDYFFSSKFFI